MVITFNPVSKLILLPDLSPNYTITAQEIYNSSMEWADGAEAMDDEPPMRSTGYAFLGSGAYSDKIFILQKGWKLKPYSGTYTLTVTGTIIALDDAGQPYDRTVPPDSGNIQWVFQVTSQGIIGVTQQDKEDIRDLVDAKTGAELHSQIAEVQTQTTNIEAHHILRKKIEGDYIRIYNAANQLIAQYRMVKDAEERIIELIPE